MTRWLPILLVASLALAGVGYAVVLRGENIRLREANEKLVEFCQATWLSVEQDRKDFESSDPQRQNAALNRFYTGSKTRHDATSFLVCLEEIPSYSTECFLGEDWKCRIDLARKIETALKTRYFR